MSCFPPLFLNFGPACSAIFLLWSFGEINQLELSIYLDGIKAKSYSKVEWMGALNFCLYASSIYVIHGWLDFHPSTSSGSSKQAALCIHPKIRRARSFYLTRWLCIPSLCFLAKTFWYGGLFEGNFWRKKLGVFLFNPISGHTDIWSTGTLDC